MNKEVKKIVACTLFAGILGMIFGILIAMPSSIHRDNDAYDYELIKAYDLYNMRVENLLDSIAAEDDCFNDTWAETDVYADYCDARYGIDTLLNRDM